jgi:hypothetical protein
MALMKFCLLRKPRAVYLAVYFTHWALSENLTDWPPLCNYLHPLNREEPTLSTAIRLEGGAE